MSAPSAPPRVGTVFYDGSCGLCHRAVKRLLAMDRAGVLRFAPLGGETFLARFDEGARRTLPDSLVYESPGGEVLTRSDALVGALRRLGPGARLLGSLLGVVPRPIRDLGYGLVAKTRRRLFAAPEGTCPRVPPDLARRFLP